MGKRAIYITDHDHERLETLVAAAGASKNGDGAALEDLRKELGRAKIVEAEKIPADVVTMNSLVRLTDVDTGEKMEYTLVFPHLANVDAARLSVLSPVGTAILGYAAGDVIQWRVPKGKRRIRIDEVVYQPEAQGHYPL